MHTDATLLSVYFMARLCADGELSSTCTERLHDRNLHPDAVYADGPVDAQVAAVFETLAVGDPRCVASVALCLRLAGQWRRLFELVSAAHAVGSGAGTLDAVLSQVVRVPGISPSGLRQISDDVLGVGSFLQIPSGLGLYYYPGCMLFAVWPGALFVAAGLAGAVTTPMILLLGTALAIAGLVGGTLDLVVVWRALRLWDRPEISRRLFVPGLASAICFWIPVLMLRSSIGPLDPLVLAGAAAAFVVAAIPPLGMRHLVFAPLPRMFVGAGTMLSVLSAATAAAMTALLPDRIPRTLSEGFYLGGMLLIAFGLNILPKRLAVLRHYGGAGRPDVNTPDWRSGE